MKKILSTALFLVFWINTGAAACPHLIERRVAFDVGSGKIKMQISDVDVTANKIINVLLSDTAKVPLREDLATSKEGMFSQEVQNQAVTAIKQLVEKAKIFRPEAYHAVATEGLRLAKNGPQLAEKIKLETGVPVTILTQQEEGILGFTSAVNEADIDPERAVSWDFGGGSFQITTLCQDQFLVYESQLGKVPFKLAILKIQGRDPLTHTPNPISLDEALKAICYIQDQICEVPETIYEKLHDKQVIVLGVGIHPLWGMPNNDGYSLQRIYEEMSDRLDLDDAAIAKKDRMTEEAAVYMVSNLILAYGVMKTLEIDDVHYVGTQGALATGLLLSPQYW